VLATRLRVGRSLNESPEITPPTKQQPTKLTTIHQTNKRTKEHALATTATGTIDNSQTKDSKTTLLRPVHQTAVRTPLNITSHAKNLLLWSELACHISGAGKDIIAPMNWHSYAVATEDFLSAVHFQKIKSFEVSKVISEMAMKSMENSSSCIGVLIWIRFLIQLLF
jgi:hypothetical protein